VPKRYFQVLRDMVWLAMKCDGQSGFWVAPRVGEGFETDSILCVESRVEELAFNEQSLLSDSP
jgi:hypothetical protein